MRTPITFGAAVLALALATSCTTGRTAGSGGVYLVGVAGGG